MDLQTLLTTIDALVKTQILDTNSSMVEVHYQKDAPLKGYIENVKVIDGNLVISLEDYTDYGDPFAWD